MICVSFLIFVTFLIFVSFLTFVPQKDALLKYFHKTLFSWKISKKTLVGKVSQLICFVGKFPQKNSALQIFSKIFFKWWYSSRPLMVLKSFFDFVKGVYNLEHLTRNQINIFLVCDSFFFLNYFAQTSHCDANIAANYFGS